MFTGWENFYLLIGGASGSLIGLLFIVMTLFSGRDRGQVLQAAAVYTTPTVFNLAVVLTISAVVMAPGLTAPLVGLMQAGAGVIGLLHGVLVMVRFRRLQREEPPHWSDFWCYCAAPAGLHLCLTLAGALVWFGQPAAAPFAACVLMLMLLAAIRNAWDLVTWMAPRARS